MRDPLQDSAEARRQIDNFLRGHGVEFQPDIMELLDLIHLLCTAVERLEQKEQKEEPEPPAPAVGWLTTTCFLTWEPDEVGENGEPGETGCWIARCLDIDAMSAEDSPEEAVLALADGVVLAAGIPRQPGPPEDWERVYKILDRGCSEGGPADRIPLSVKDARIMDRFAYIMWTRPGCPTRWVFWGA